MTPNELHNKIQEIVFEQQNKVQEIYANILEELVENNIFIIEEKDLTEKQGEFVRNYFTRKYCPTWCQ